MTSSQHLVSSKTLLLKMLILYRRIQATSINKVSAARILIAAYSPIGNLVPASLTLVPSFLPNARLINTVGVKTQLSQQNSNLTVKTDLANVKVHTSTSSNLTNTTHATQTQVLTCTPLLFAPKNTNHLAHATCLA